MSMLVLGEQLSKGKFALIVEAGVEKSALVVMGRGELLSLAQGVMVMVA